MNDVLLSEILDFLADLSLNAPNFEVARAALRLQSYLLSEYGENLL